MVDIEVSTVLCIFILTISGASVAGAKCPDGTDISQYTGQVSVTDGGRPCQKWAKMKPHQHNFTMDDNFPLDGTAKAAENFCRNVDNDPAPWCYTRDVNARWQYCYETVCGVEGPKCGGSVKSPSGWLTSIDRNNNGLYDRYRDCLWVLKAPGDRRVRVRVLSMDVEKSDDCNADYLQIYESSVYHGKFCGDSKPTILSESNWLYVRWYSAGGDIGRGFNLTYTHVDNETEVSTTPLHYTEPADDVTDAPPTGLDIPQRGAPNVDPADPNRLPLTKPERQVVTVLPTLSSWYSLTSLPWTTFSTYSPILFSTLSTSPTTATSPTISDESLSTKPVFIPRQTPKLGSFPTKSEINGTQILPTMLRSPNNTQSTGVTGVVPATDPVDERDEDGDSTTADITSGTESINVVSLVVLPVALMATFT